MVLVVVAEVDKIKNKILNDFDALLKTVKGENLDVMTIPCAALSFFSVSCCN